MIAEIKPPQPFVKWVGGKRQLIPTLLSHLPKEYKINDNCYYEPFVGGGSLLFALQPKLAFINDINSELINVYQVIKNWLDALIDDLNQHKYEKDYFQAIREWDRKQDYQSKTPVQRASRIIYLNKTCFNGLYRVNNKGHFNVPFGSYKNPTILDKDNLIAVNQYFNTHQVMLLNLDFQEAVKDAKKGDFIYLDPPYDPGVKNEKFTKYDKTVFGREEQIRLKKTFDDLNSRGCYVLLSNACTEFIIDLYKDYNQTQIMAS